MKKLFKFSVHRVCLILSLLFVTVGCDQITKVVVRDTMSSSQSFSYFNNSVVLSHAENPGAFLSLGAGLQEGLRFWIFTIAVAIFLLVTLLVLLRKTSMDKWSTVAITLLVAGGVGNLIDRIYRGSVTDFINLGIGSLRTGIFNVADMAIVGGVLILLVVSFVEKKSLKTQS